MYVHCKNPLGTHSYKCMLLADFVFVDFVVVVLVLHCNCTGHASCMYMYDTSCRLDVYLGEAWWQAATEDQGCSRG